MKSLFIFLVPVILVASPALAAEKRELDAHEHGVSKVQIAVEGKVVEVALEAPGVDIVGFEHPATSSKDKAAVKAALEKLEQAEAVVVPDAAAGCKLKEAHAQLHSEGEHDEKDGHDKHAKHDDDHKHEHKEAKKDDHKHNDHKHDDHAKEKASHTEFEAHYHFDCAKPEALKTVSFPFFKSFKNAEEIEAQYVTAAGAGAAELTADKATLTLK